MKILITGGHVTPALAVIDYLLDKKICSIIDITFVGRKYAVDYERTLSFEYKEVTKRNLRFIHLYAGRFTRIASWRTVLQLLRIPFGFVQSMQILLQNRPEKILSFGGYIGFPVTFIAWLLRIPVFIHEQTISPGIANRLSSVFARTVFCSFPSVVKLFPHSKVLYTGNPIREKLNSNILPPPFQLSEKKPVIYVTGGSLGSHSINAHIFRLVPKLLPKFIVVHQTGDVREYHDFEQALIYKNKLPKSLQDDYIIHKHLSEEEVAWIYRRADLVIARAGANTIFELLHLQKPSILIPLPWSSKNEQQKHALLFKSHGIGEIFEQTKSSEELYTLIETIYQNKKTYHRKFKELPFQIPLHASKTIVNSICNS